MANLDDRIAAVAIAVGKSRAAMTAVAQKAAPALTTADLAKLPGRWYPTYSAKAAGAPKLGDFWGRLWFEAITELLYQRGEEGLPGLYEFLDRADASYHEYAVLRLLRLAADGVAKDAILARVRARLATLVHVSTREAANQAAEWAGDDPRPLALLQGMADIVVPQSYGDTVGSMIEQAVESVAARSRPKGKRK